MIYEMQTKRQGADPRAFSTGRPVVMGTHGAVASPHYLASAAGLSMLQAGGHAVDAAIAINIVLSVVYNHMAGLGGDLFCQVWDHKEKKVRGLNGSGRSGEEARREKFHDRGMDAIPQRGPLAAITVPGTVDAWFTLHKKYGKLPWKTLFEPAIVYAVEGFPLSEKFRDYISRYTDILEENKTTARVYLPGGMVPETGRIFRQEDLGKSLRMIAEEGAEVFYQGELGRKILQGLRNAGGLLTKADFAEHRSDWVEVIRTDYRGYTVTELPPNTQGLTALVLLNLLEAYNLNDIGDNTADFYHLMAECAKLSFIPRDRWVTDPDFLDIPLKKLTGKTYAEKLGKLINLEQAIPEEEARRSAYRINVGGDTTYMCAVDAEGNACSLIQSVYFEFGSAFMPEGTGILLQNRGSFFKLSPDHPNALEPRKRTFHTIIPALMLKNDKPFMVFGSMGGEGQPQTQAAVVSRVVDFGYDIQQAIEAPRWLYGRTWGEESSSLKLEGRISDSVTAELRRRGHEVEMTENLSQKMGHAQGIVIDQETGVLSAGADPRGDGLALCW